MREGEPTNLDLEDRDGFLQNQLTLLRDRLRQHDRPEIQRISAALEGDPRPEGLRLTPDESYVVDVLRHLLKGIENMRTAKDLKDAGSYSFDLMEHVQKKGDKNPNSIELLREILAPAGMVLNKDASGLREKTGIPGLVFFDEKRPIQPEQPDILKRRLGVEILDPKAWGSLENWES